MSDKTHQKELSQYIDDNCKYTDIYEVVGYKILGPILLGFSIWLNEEIKKEKPNTVLFLSREGLVLLKAYIELFGDLEDTRIEYANVSRLSLAKATMVNTRNWDDVERKYASLFRGVNSIIDLFSLFDIPIDNDSFSAAEIRANDKLCDIKDKKKIYELLIKIGGDSLKKQNVMAIQYLQSKGVGEGKTLICDIGWSGTMQLLVQELFPQESIIGCYLAVTNLYNNKEYALLDRRSFWCCDNDGTERWEMIRFTQSAFEFLFLNNEGTTLGYYLDGERISPIKRKEVKAPNEKIDGVHEAALQFLRDCGDEKLIEHFKDATTDLWMAPYIRFAVYPNMATLNFYSGFSFIDGKNEFDFLPKEGIITYLCNPLKAKNEFEQNNCKIIWLYGLIRLRLPYFRMLKFLTKRVGLKSTYEKRYMSRKRL